MRAAGPGGARRGCALVLLFAVAGVANAGAAESLAGFADPGAWQVPARVEIETRP